MGLNKQELLGKKGLTDFEKRWLADRNIEHPEVGKSVDDVPAPGDVDNDSTSDAGTDAGGETVLPYEEWTQADLSAEAAARGLAKTGTKADLVARLQKDDADNA